MLKRKNAISRPKEYRSIFHTIKAVFWPMLAGLFLATLTAPTVSANGVIVYFWGSDFAEIMVNTFLINIPLNTVILLYPIARHNWRKDIKPFVRRLDLLAVPLITIWGCYFDSLAFIISYTTWQLDMALSMVIGLFSIFVTYFVVVHWVLEYDFRLAVIIASFSILVNGLCWTLLTSMLPHFDLNSRIDYSPQLFTLFGFGITENSVCSSLAIVVSIVILSIIVFRLLPKKARNGARTATAKERIIAVLHSDRGKRAIAILAQIGFLLIMAVVIALHRTPH